MYLIARDKITITGLYSVRIDLDMSQTLKVVRTDACKAGEYALFKKADEDKDKFTIFCGYITYNDVCDSFEMVKVRKLSRSK